MRKILLAACSVVGLSPLLQAHAAGDASAIHGFFDVSLQNDYITPRGLMVTNKGLTSQVLDGLVIALPDNLSFTVGTWEDVDSAQNNGTVGALNEFDWFAGPAIKVGRAKFSAQLVQFLSPPGSFTAETNVELAAYYDDTGSFGPLSLQPYGKFFYAVSGDSTVITGRHGDTFDVELGGVPTLDMHSYGLPLTLTAPTWVTVGPQNYWGGHNGNLGVFSTGIASKIPITAIGSQYGSWYFKAGIQYYDFINKELQIAQTLDGTDNAASNGHAGAFLFMAGFGFGF